MTALVEPVPVRPLIACGTAYRDQYVVVRRTGRGPAFDGRTGADGRLRLRWCLTDDSVHDDLAPALARWLASVGHADRQTFERALTGIVLTSRGDPLAAWAAYYRRTLARVADPRSAGYVEVYRHALDLIGPGSVLDAGCGMGFLSLLLAARGQPVTACDASAGTVGLLQAVSARSAVGLDVLVADARAVPRPDRSAGTVVLLHVLEHLPPVAGEQMIAEAQRLAARRVVLAVPYESSPTAAYGHCRTVDHADLVALGRRSGWASRVHDRPGGWLVLDRPD